MGNRRPTYKYQFTALRPFAFESACPTSATWRLATTSTTHPHTSSSSSSPWPDTDRAPSFRRSYHRKTHAALKYCGAADVLSLLSLPPYSSTRHHFFLSRPDARVVTLASSGLLWTTILLLRSSSRRRGVPSVGSARPSGIFFPHAVSHLERPAAHASLSLFTPLLSRSGRAMDSRADSVWTLNTPPLHFPSSVSSPRSQFASSLHDHRQNPARGPGGRIHARIRSGHRTHRPVPRRTTTGVAVVRVGAGRFSSVKKIISKLITAACSVKGLVDNPFCTELQALRTERRGGGVPLRSTTSDIWPIRGSVVWVIDGRRPVLRLSGLCGSVALVSTG